MWSIIEPKGGGSNKTPPFPMSSNTLRRRKPYLFLLEFKEWAEEQRPVGKGTGRPRTEVRSHSVRSGTADGLRSWLHREGSKYSDWGPQEDRCWTVVGCLPEKHSHWGSGRLLGSLCEPRKETTDRKWNIPGILLTSLNQLKVRNVSEHISDRSLADMDSSFSPGSRSGRNRGQSEKEQMSHLPLVQGKEHGSCPHSYLLPP